jgi:hypothetical protein
MSSSEADVRSIPPATRHRMPGTACMDRNSIEPMEGEVLGEGAAVPGACERRTVPTRDGQSRTVGIPRLAVAHLGFAELASRAAPRHECDPARLHHVIPVTWRVAEFPGRVRGDTPRAASPLHKRGSMPACFELSSGCSQRRSARRTISRSSIRSRTARSRSSPSPW